MKFFLALYLIVFGVAIAGAVSQLYHLLCGERAALRFDGKSVFGMLGRLLVSFLCGPYIMLSLGISHVSGEKASLPTVVVSTLVAFTWSFLVGLLAIGLYVGITPAFAG